MRARSENAEAEQALARLFELLSLEEGAGTVAEEARTRSTKHDDVSDRHGRRMRSSSSEPRQEEPKAEMCADLSNPFAHRGLLRPMVDSYVSGHHPSQRSTTSLSSKMR